MKKIILTLFCSFLLFISFAQEDAKSIIEKSDQIYKGLSNISTMTMKIVRPKWTREMKLKTWAKGDNYSLILIQSPVKDKGIVFLKRQKEIWNWMPSIERTVKLPPSMMMQSWMGTDMTNDDLVKQSSIVVDYDHKIVGDSIIEGRKCWKIELIPHEDAPVVWGKIYSWVDQKDFLTLRTEFFDEDMYLINIMSAHDIKTMGGKILPARMEIIPVEEEGHKTILIYNSIEFNVDIQDSFFSISNMKRIR
jgi:outer membrane lipoprotein-sorting protein